jgi:hypothetical protein
MSECSKFDEREKVRKRGNARRNDVWGALSVLSQQLIYWRPPNASKIDAIQTLY